MTRCYPGLLGIQLHHQQESPDTQGKDGPEQQVVSHLRRRYNLEVSTHGFQRTWMLQLPVRRIATVRP